MAKTLGGHALIFGGHILNGHGKAASARVNLITQFSASDWVPVPLNTITDDVDGSVLITHVDNFTGGAIPDLSAIMSESLVEGQSYLAAFNAKITGGTKAIRINGPTDEVSVTTAGYAEYTIPFVAAAGSNFFQARQFSSGATMNIKDLAVYAL